MKIIWICDDDVEEGIALVAMKHTSANEWMSNERNERAGKKWKNKIKIQYAKPHKLSECSSNSNSNDGSSIYAHNCTNYEHIYSVCILNNKIHAHRTYGIQRSLAFALRKATTTAAKEAQTKNQRRKMRMNFRACGAVAMRGEKIEN